jgi:hypothetical protein
VSAAAEDSGKIEQEGDSQDTTAAAAAGVAEAAAAEEEEVVEAAAVAVAAGLSAELEGLEDLSASDEHAAMKGYLHEAKDISLKCQAELLLSGTSRAPKQDVNADSKSAAAADTAAAAAGTADTAEGATDERQQPAAAAAAETADLSEDVLALLLAVPKR